MQGDDELPFRRAFTAWLKQFDSGAFAGMNSVRVDGRAIQRGELANPINMLPLGGEKRLVVVDHALESLKAKADQEWLAEILKAMPETTVLALVIPDSQKYKSGEMVWQTAGKGIGCEKR